MKREPTTERAKDTKQTILKATAHILLKEGMDKTNTNLIAERAGVSIGSLYQYYKNKEEIYEDLFLTIIEKREERISSALGIRSLVEPVSKSIERVVDAILDTESDEDILVEAMLVPLMIRSGNEKKMFAEALRMESVVGPAIKTLIALKNPKLLKRDIDTIIFILIQALRGVFLGLSLPRQRSITKESLKRELRALIQGYLEHKPN